MAATVISLRAMAGALAEHGCPQQLGEAPVQVSRAVYRWGLVASA
jgi:hypothetical protein